MYKITAADHSFEDTSADRGADSGADSGADVGAMGGVGSAATGCLSASRTRCGRGVRGHATYAEGVGEHPKCGRSGRGHMTCAGEADDCTIYAGGAGCYTICAKGGGRLTACMPEVLEAVLHMLGMLEGMQRVEQCRRLCSMCWRACNVCGRLETCAPKVGDAMLYVR